LVIFFIRPRGKRKTQWLGSLISKRRVESIRKAC